MADQKISDLAAAASVTGPELIPVVQSGVNRSATPSVIKTFILTGTTGGETLIGGTAVGDALNLQGTSGNGTSSTAAINLNVGNNGATTALSVLNSGKVGVNTTAPLTTLTVAETSTSSPRGILSQQFNDGTDAARVGFSKARGTPASPTTIQTGDYIGRLMMRAYDGANYLEMASIEGVATGTVASTRVPTALAFNTATDAAPSVLTERMRIDNAGKVGIGTNAPSAATHIVYTTEQLRVGYDTSNYWKATVGSTGGLALAGVGTGGSLGITPTTGQSITFTLGTTGNFVVNTTDLCVNTSSSAVGVGVLAPSAKLHSLATTEQLRLGYDVSNYASFTVSSAGALAVAPTGALSIKPSGVANGQAVSIKALTELTTIAASATTDTAIQMPAGALILSVSVRVTAAVTCTSTFTVGDAGSATRFSTAAVSKALNSTDPGTKAGVYYNASAAAIRITPDTTPSDNTGRVRVTITYIDITAPTS